jgi:hypothetical protein
MLTKTTTRTLNNSIRTAAFSKIAASRAQHTLPQLPYAYDVRFECRHIFFQKRIQVLTNMRFHLGFGAEHLQRNHDLASHQAPPDLCQWSQRRRRIAHQASVPGSLTGDYQGCHQSSTCLEIQRRWTHQPFPILEEPGSCRIGANQASCW